MKILKTSKQAKEEKLAMQKAQMEMQVCPECGTEVRQALFPFACGNKAKKIYHAICSQCGCEWESSEF